MAGELAPGLGGRRPGDDLRPDDDRRPDDHQGWGDQQSWGDQPGWGGRVVGRDPDPAPDEPSDAPTPPTGLPLGSLVASSGPPEDDPDDATPPAGIAGLSGVVSSEDFGSAGPAVFGGVDPVAEQGRGDAGEWPTLTYRSKGKSKRSRGALDWLRGTGEAS